MEARGPPPLSRVGALKYDAGMDPSLAPQQAARLVTFRVEDQVLGIALESVVRVERAAAVTPLHGGPPCLMGALNHHGRILPVLDLRRRLGLPARALQPNDQFLLVRCGLRTVVVPVDRVEGLSDTGPPIQPEEVVGVHLEGQGLATSEEGILVIQDPDRLLNPVEEVAFESAIAGPEPTGSEPPA